MATPRGLTRIIWIAGMLLFFSASSPILAALSPLGEVELSGVDASTGVKIHFDNLKISNQFNKWRFSPEDTDANGENWTNYIGLSNGTGSRTINGDLSILASAYESPQRKWFIEDTAKLWLSTDSIQGLGDSYEHFQKPYEIVKPDGYQTPAEARGQSVVTLGLGDGSSVVATQNMAMDLSFSANGRTTNPGSSAPVVNGVLEVQSGRLSIVNAKTYGQQITIYPMGGMASGEEGIALEIRSKTAIEQVKLVSNDGTTNALIKGVHMRESFDQAVHTQYAKWGYMRGPYFTSDGNDQYFKSTFDPDGYFGTDYTPQDTPIDPTIISAPYSGGPGFHNMYDGYMLNGNINQIAFYDRIAGKLLPYDSSNYPYGHNQQTSADKIKRKTFDGSGDVEGDYQIRNQTAANNIPIEEAPMTIQVKSGRTYMQYDPNANGGRGGISKQFDDRAYIAINWTRHGSIRIEEVQGFLSDDDETTGWPYVQLGPSMGSVIIDGMRAKKTYIEFPGRKECYAITEQNMDTQNDIRHHYVYEAGKLPDNLNMNGLASGQAAWDPIGRGQLEFMARLGNASNPTTERWDMYAIQKEMGGETYDFWHIYEPHYPGPNDAAWTPDH